MVPAPPPRAATIRPGGKLLVWSANEASGARLMQEARRGGFDAAFVSNLTEARNRLTQEGIAVCVLDEPSSIQTVRDLANACTAVGKVVQFVVLPPVGAAYVDAPNAPECCDVLRPPMSIDKLAGALFRAAARASIIEMPEPAAPQQSAQPIYDPLTGHSPSITSVRERVREVAQTQSPVLISGPQGSGTNVAARAIHYRQFGTEAPFVIVRCAVLTGGALEQELFGDSPIHASVDSGLWAAAANGTLLLDDIDQVPLSMQGRLVKLLAAQIIRNAKAPEGTPSSGPRIVAATHVDLEERVRDGRFDPELYRVLRQSRIEMPALTRRLEDIVPIASEILTGISQYDGRPLCRLTGEAVDLLKGHHWSENVRELKNVLHRACSLFIGGDVSAEMIRPWLENSTGETIEEPGMTLQEMERKLIEATFNRYAGNREMTAKALQIGLRTLSGKLREYGYPPRGGPGSNRVRRVA
ncbi:MAG: sigma-54-dependent transcriptional regulator [Planctomycetaceae bacterium]